MSAEKRLSLGRRAALQAAIAVLLPVAWLSAQAAVPGGGGGLATQQPPATTPQVSVTAGRSTIVSTDFDITRISITNQEVADAVVVKPREILVDGKAPGTISLIVWGATERIQYDVVVEQPVSPLEQRLHHQNGPRRSPPGSPCGVGNCTTISTPPGPTTRSLG